MSPGEQESKCQVDVSQRKCIGLAKTNLNLNLLTNADHHSSYYACLPADPGGGGYSLYWPILGSSALEGWLQVYDEKVGVLLIEVYERVGKSFIWVCDNAQRAEQMNFMAL